MVQAFKQLMVTEQKYLIPGSITPDFIGNGPLEKELNVFFILDEFIIADLKSLFPNIS
jgi:hypothetical protein